MKGKLGVYHLMIVSKYFNSMVDYINLELSTPKAKGNIEKFHYNPIPLDNHTRQYWTSLQTLHVYNKRDNHFYNETFYKKVLWYEISCDEWMHFKRDNEIYKNVVMNVIQLQYIGTIPDGVIQLRSISSFYDYYGNKKHIQQLTIPSSVRYISSTFLQSVFWSSTEVAITFPSHFSVVGNIVMNTLLPDYQLSNPIKIPSGVKTINGKDVGKFEEVKEFDIPAHLTQLVDESFSYCNFTKITIPSTIKELPDQCFRECKRLKEVIIPDSVTKLGYRCFYNCSSLSSVNIPNSVVEIGRYCFEGLSSLKSIELPTSVTKVGGSCFYECSSLSSVNIPTSVVEIGDCCFRCCTSLKEIDVPTSVTKFGCQLFQYCSSLTSITLHDNYKEVNGYDFHACTSLSSIVLPSSVTRIRFKAFWNCPSLTSINLQNIKEFEKSCFLFSGITREKYPQLPDICWQC